MKKLMIIFLALMLLGTWGLAASANAILIEVSQESSAGASDFDDHILGTITPWTPWTTPSTIEDCYKYSEPHEASYNGDLYGGPILYSNASQVFLVDASDGLSLVVLHDAREDGSGGSVTTQWNLTGDPDGASFVMDESLWEPEDINEILYTPDGIQFESSNGWLACCTDGFAIGPLDGNWTMYGQFLNYGGIFGWGAASSEPGETIIFALQEERRVRLRPVSVPEPGSLLLLFSLCTGLVGLGGFKRKL